MHPRVSVVITTYNQAPYIRQAVDSALGQTFRSRDILVVDDGSTDDTQAALAPYRDRINYIRQGNRGVAGSRNTGVRHARGELLAFLDGDDLWDPVKLEIQVAAAESAPLSGLIAVNGVEFSGDSILQSSLLGKLIEDRLTPARPLVTLDGYRDLLKGNPVATMSQVMIPRRVLDEVGPSNTHLKLSSDWDLYLRIAARHQLTFLDRSLVRWRYLATSASGPAAVRPLRWTEDDLEVLKAQLKNGPPRFAPQIREELARRMSRVTREAYYYGRQHNRRWAMKYLLDLLRKNPGQGKIYTALAGLTLPQSVVSRMARRVRRPSSRRKLLGRN